MSQRQREKPSKAPLYSKRALRQCLAVITSYAWVLTHSVNAHAVIATGRFTFGGFISQENLSPNVTIGSAGSNDFQTFSGRMYLNLQKVGSFDLTTDLRDKHDFFDHVNPLTNQQVNPQQLPSYSSADDFQVYEASAKYPNRDGSFYASLGRFNLMEAGGAFVDGIELGKRFANNWRFGFFGGHNPKRPEDWYVRTDNPDYDYGLYLNYQSPSGQVDRYLNASTALYFNQVNGFADRIYLFSNIVYQRNASSHWISNLFLDFVPRVFIQNGMIYYNQGVGSKLDFSLQASAVDAIGYQEIHNILETLPSSAYHELDFQTRYLFKSTARILFDTRWGERDVDGKLREEIKLGAGSTGFLGEKLALTGSIGWLHDFIAEGPEALFDLGYFSRKWDCGLTTRAAVQTRTDGDPNNTSALHPLMLDLHFGNIMNRVLYSMVSFQYAQNEIVSAISAFFKITYRFGPNDLAPVNDKAPAVRSL